MGDIGFFLTAAAGLSADPIVLVGYILAGIYIRRWGVVALICAAWAIAITLVLVEIYGPSTVYPPDFETMARIAGGLVVGTVTWAVARWVRQRRAARQP